MSVSKIEFEWMTVQNLFSIGDEIKFDFTKHFGTNYVYGYNNDVPVLDHSPDDLIGESESKNGCGKSTLFVDAIMFGLYGKPGKEIKKTNIVHRKRKKNALVKISFSIGDKKYMVVNGASPTICEVWLDGVNISKSTSPLTQVYIQKEILRTPYSIFKNSIILSVSDTTPIYAMKTAEKREFTNTIFNLNIYGDMFKKVRKDINTLDREVIASKSTYTANTGTLDTLKLNHKNFEIDKKDNQESLLQSIKSKGESKADVPYDIEALKANISAVTTVLDKGNTDKTAIDGAIRTLSSQVDTLEFNVTNNSKFIHDNKSIIDCLCSDCTVSIQAVIPYDDVKERILNDGTSIDALNGKLEQLDSALKLVNTTIKDSTAEYREYSSQQTSCDSIIMANNAIDAEVKALQVEYDRVSKTESSFGAMIEDYTTRNESVLDTLNQSAEHRKYLKAMDAILGENGVKSWIVDQLVDTLNTRMRYYLERMGAEYVVIFDANFEYVFHTSTGPCEYFNFSAGERMRINHATLFAFKDLLAIQGNLDTSILVCDEILDVSIDSKATNALINIINEYAKTQTVFIISHKESISNYNNFDNVIEICKENGFTQIVSDAQGEFGEQ